MADVKLKKYGLKDIIYFTNKPKEREKRIQASSAGKTSATFKCNEKAAARHPNEQEFIIEKIVERGNGITPVLSMAKAIASRDEDFRLTVLYGSRTKADILFAAEFAEIMDKTDKVQLVNVLSDEEAEGCEHGFITAELIKKYAGEGAYSLFASGPQGMYGFLDKEIESLGLDQRHYRKELFGSIKQPWTLPGYPQEAKNKVFTLKVKMCNKDYEIPCRADENMLVALERAGIAGGRTAAAAACAAGAAAAL